MAHQYRGFANHLQRVKYYFLDNEYYFKRSGLYGFYDDGERFAFFSGLFWKCSTTLILSRKSSTATTGKPPWFPSFGCVLPAE